MKKILLSALIALSLIGTTVSADAGKGQKLYMKKLKSSCGISGAAMAGKHTQDEWETIHNAGNLKKEIQVICPGIKENKIKEKYQEHYFDFFYNFSSDSGNVPSC